MNTNMHESLKSIIVGCITEKPGLRAVELMLNSLNARTLQLYGLIHEDVASSYQDILEELLREGKLIEVEYVTREMDYRVKSIFFPVGTDIKIKR